MLVSLEICFWLGCAGAMGLKLWTAGLWRRCAGAWSG